MADRLISLEIREVPDAGGQTFIYNLSLDGTPIVLNKALSVTQSDLMRDIGASYAALFEAQGCGLPNPQQSMASIVNAQIKEMGGAFFDIWLASHWTMLAIPASDRPILAVVSDVADILNLPWELLQPSRQDIGSDTKWGIQRMPPIHGPPADNLQLSEGPLRVLFVASSPRGEAELDFEREEEFLLRAVGPKVRLEIATLGTFEELADRIYRFEPHIVHLSGHGEVKPGGAKFLFEDAKGERADVSAQRLAEAFSDNRIRCVFVSGCYSSRAPSRSGAAGLCQAIVDQGVPMAIGWEASIVDTIATTLAENFYRTVALGRDVHFALAQARRKAKTVLAETGDPSWSLPVLYANTNDTRLFDTTMPPRAEPAPNTEHTPLPPIAGFARYLVGRRRELQVLLPALINGDLRGVVLTGMGGSGKSALAIRLARKLEADAGLSPIAICSAPGTPLTGQSILDSCLETLILKKSREAYDRAVDSTIPISLRLQLLVSDLNNDFAIVIDGLETTLRDDRHVIGNQEVAGFYRDLLQNLTGTSRIIITSRKLPRDIVPLPSDIQEFTISEFSDTSFMKFMFRDKDISKTFQSRRQTLRKLCERFGSLPQFALQLRTKLVTLDADQLDVDIADAALDNTVPDARPLQRLDAEHDQICNNLDLARHYGSLTPNFKKALLQLAVFRDSFTPSALTKVSGLTPAQVEQALGEFRLRAFIHSPLPGAPPSVIYGTLRRWLLCVQQNSTNDVRNAHRIAANYLVEIESEQSGGRLHKSNAAILMSARSHFLACKELEAARQVTYKLSEILLRRSDLVEIERLNLELMDATPKGRSPHPDPATWIARSYIDRPDYEKASYWYEKAQNLATDHVVERAHALQGLGTISLRTGNFEKARDFLTQALALQEEANDLLGQALSYHQFGSIAFSQNDFVAARSEFNRIPGLLRRFRETAPRGSIALEQADEVEQAVLHQLGSIELEENQLEPARELFDKALAMALEHGDDRPRASALHQLGRIDGKEGNIEQARTILSDALTIRWRIGDRTGEILSFKRLGELATQYGRPDLQLKLMIAGYAVSKAIKSNDDGFLERIKELASALTIGAAERDAMIAGGEKAYFRDRGRSLLRQISALTTPVVVKH